MGEQADADVARQQRDAMSHRVDVVSANLADSIQQTSVTDAQSSDDREALSHRIDDLAAESGEVNEGQVECQWEDYGFCTCHGWVSMVISAAAPKFLVTLAPVVPKCAYVVRDASR